MTSSLSFELELHSTRKAFLSLMLSLRIRQMDSAFAVKMIIRYLSQLLPIISIVNAAQPSAPAPVSAPLRELPWGQLNFLQTTDTHGWHAGHLQEHVIYMFSINLKLTREIGLLTAPTGEIMSPSPSTCEERQMRLMWIYYS